MPHSIALNVVLKQRFDASVALTHNTGGTYRKGCPLRIVGGGFRIARSFFDGICTSGFVAA